MSNFKFKDVDMAKWVCVSTKTLQNWKKPINKEGLKFYPPYGRHNLYKSLKAGYYLYSFPIFINDEAEEESLHFCKMEFIRDSVNILSYLVNLSKSDPKYLVDLEKVINDLKGYLEPLYEF